MQRHDRRLNPKPDNETEEDDLPEKRGVRCGLYQAPGGERQSGVAVCEHYAGKNEGGSGKAVYDIAKARGLRFRITFVNNQGVGKQGEKFIKEVKGEQVGGKGDPHGGPKR